MFNKSVRVKNFLTIYVGLSFWGVNILGYLFLSFNVALAQDINSPNFTIKGDTVSAGSSNGDSNSFGLAGDVNPFSDLSDSVSFRQEVGFNPRIQALTPAAPLLENSSNAYYDRLLLTVNSSGNPSDTLFAIIVSSDNFSTYNYVQNDNTLGVTLGTEDYQTYNDWGGASGFLLLGLEPNTTYKARVKALNGDFTETGYGPESASATTTVPFINLTVSESALAFGVLSASSISQTSTLDITVNTNGELGYQAYINGTGNAVSGGLYNGSDIILSASTILSPGTEGYGAQASSGSASIDTKYDLSGNNVGSVDILTSELSSNTSPVNSETTTVLFKSTISGTTASGDYSDTVYFTVSPVL